MAFSYEQEIFGVVCSFFAMCMVCVCSIEIRNFRRKKTIISGKQLAVRLLGGALMLILLVRILHGIYWVEYPHRVDADYFLRYWAGCLGLAYICLMAAAVDMYFTMRLRRSTRKVARGLSDRLGEISRLYQKPTSTVNLEPPTGTDTVTGDVQSADS